MDLRTPKVMGIINLTPDSFYGQSRAIDHFLDRASEMIDEGADILDLGAQSTRPGAERLSADEEWDRLKRPLQEISQRFPEITLSVDTFHSEVARRAVESGAHWINDVSGGTLDDRMFDTIAELRVPYVLMHIQGTPENMQNDPIYEDVVAEVMKHLAEREFQLLEKGINDLIIDPGFGFGKTVEQNYDLLASLGSFSNFQRPIMVGLSRKSMVNRVLGTRPEEALNGSTILHTMALERGANILRVHDVREAVQAVKLFLQLEKSTS